MSLAGGDLSSTNSRTASSGRPHAQSNLTGQSLSQFATQPLETVHSSRSRQQNERISTFQSRDSQRKAAEQEVGQPVSLQQQKTRKMQGAEVGVRPEYYVLNPWYMEEPKDGLFGLAKPLPHTIRKGMWWGKKDLKDNIFGIESKDEQGESDPELGQGGGLDENGQPREEPGDTELRGRVGSPGPLPDQLETEIGGRRVGLRKLREDEAEDYLNTQGIPREALRIPSSKAGQMRTFGLQDGLPDLREEKVSGHDQYSEQEQSEDEGERQERERREFYDNHRNPLARLRAKYPQAPAEWLATMITIFLGLTANLAVITSDNQRGSTESEAWAWGFAVMTGIYLAGGVSGAHLNPSISVTLSIFRGFPWKMCFVYFIAQVLASICAGALAWAIYADAIHHSDPLLTPAKTGLAFYTLPQGWVSPATAFFTEFLAAAIMSCVILALGDDQNAPPCAGTNALIIGLVNVVLILSMGYNTGPAINPVRDLGPRLVCLWVGYPNTFSGGWWFYGPWAASLSGSIIGALVYDTIVFVGNESPLNWSWPQKGDIVFRTRRAKNTVKRKTKEKFTEHVSEEESR